MDSNKKKKKKKKKKKTLGRRVDGFLPDYCSIPPSYLPTPFPSPFVNGMQLCHTDIYLAITN